LEYQKILGKEIVLSRSACFFRVGRRDKIIWHNNFIVNKMTLFKLLYELGLNENKNIKRHATGLLKALEKWNYARFTNFNVFDERNKNDIQEMREIVNDYYKNNYSEN
jgi:hypothetical protein